MAATITNQGLAIITGRLMPSSSQASPTYLQIGTGGTAEAITQTSLANPSPEARVSATPAQSTTAVTNDSFQVVGEITSTGTQSVTEIGWFDAAGSGTPATGGAMLGRVVIPHVDMQLDDKLDITLTLFLVSGT